MDERLSYQNQVIDTTSLSLSKSTNDYPYAKRLWIDIEARRKLLLVAFVLDTQHSALFQQPPCYTLDLNHDNLPYPCSAQVWDCSDANSWYSLVTHQQTFDMRYLGDVNSSPPAPVDAFQSLVFSCFQIHLRYGCHFNLVQHSSFIFYSPITHERQAYLTHHALLLAKLAPVESLLIVSSGSWLFGTKVTENSAWISAKATLRVWVGTEDAAKSVWHAIQLLRLAFNGSTLHMLHEQWCLYLAALVCWAYGFVSHHMSAVNPEIVTSHVAEAQKWEFISAMDVPSWEEIPHVSLKGKTRGLLECVRARISGSPGGLLNQAEDVLARLVEGRSQLPEF